MGNFNHVPTADLIRAARAAQARGSAPQRMKMRGFGDFVEPTIEAVHPATSVPRPIGPANFPAKVIPTPPTTPSDPNNLVNWMLPFFDLMETMSNQLQAIYGELVKQNIASVPIIRASAIDNTGETLNWEAVGVMDRLMIRNEGPDSAWFSFDQNGQSVVASTSPQSFELQQNESVNLTHCKFSKIGLKTAGGKAATVHAIAFQSVAGNQAAAID